MATGSTIYKARLDISDIDRHYYHIHELTLAKHPSETDYRLMIRLIAFALNADEHLAFTKGLSAADDEPELQIKNYSDDIMLWIEFGQCDEKRLRKASGRSKHVIVYLYNEGAARAWWSQNENKFMRFENVSVILLHIDQNPETLFKRSMRLQCTIMEGGITLHSDVGDFSVRQEHLKYSK
jgi:uncharacterized protein YaeQ